MTTKFYLHATTSGLPTGTLPSDEQSTLTPDSNDFEGSRTTNRLMNTSIGVSQANLTNTSTGDTNAHNYYVSRWVSPVIYQTQIAANTWTMEYGAKEANAAANFPRNGAGAMYAVVYAWKPSAGTKYGNIIDGNSNADGEEAGTTQSVINFTFSGSALTSLIPGDTVIVTEIWAQVTQGNGTTRVQDIYYDGTTENSTSNEAAFLSTPEDLIFTETADNMTTLGTCSAKASTANTTQYWPVVGNESDPSTTEADVKIKVRQAGTLSRLSIRLNANSISGNTTFTLRKNAADGNQVCTFGASVSGLQEDLTHTDSVSAGDDLDIKSVPGAATNTFNITTICEFFTATDSTTAVCIFGNSGSSTITQASSTRYLTYCGNLGHDGTEAKHKIKQRLQGTYQNFYLNVRDNARTTTTTFISRKNGADGNITVSVGSTATGVFEDTSHTDTVAVNDDYNLKLTTGTGTETLTLNTHKIEFNNINFGGVLIAATGIGRTYTVSSTFFPGMCGVLTSPGTESDNKRRVRHSTMRLYDLNVNVQGNTMTADSTLTSRINGVDGTLTVTITQNVTGWFSDTTHVDTVGSSDDINWKIVVGSGTTMSLNCIEVYYRPTQVDFARSISESSISDTETIAAAQVLARTLSESSISSTDSAARTYNSNRSLSESSISSTDSTVRVLGYPRTISESAISSTDTLDRRLDFFRTLSEAAITVSDSATRLYNAFRTNSESSISSTDDVARTIGYPRSINESAITVSDQLDRRLDFFRTLTEAAISSTDSAVRAVTNSRAISEASIAVSDLAERIYNAFRTNPESVTSGDQLDRSVTNSRAINESSISSTDQAARTYGANRSLNESSINSGDTLTKSQVLSRLLTEAAISVADQLDRRLDFFRTLTESAISSGDSVVRAITNNRTLSEAGIAVSDLLDRIYNAFRTNPESVSVTDDVSGEVTSVGNFNRNLNESVTSGDQLNRSVTNNRSLPESVSSGDTVDRRIDFFRIITEATTTVTDSLVKSLVLARNLADSVVSGDSINRLLNIFRSNPETITSGDSIDRSLSLNKSLPESTGVSDSVDRSVTNSRPLNESVSSGDSVSRSISFIRDLLDSIGVTDFVERAAQMTRQLIQSVPVLDNLITQVTGQQDVSNTDMPILINNWLEKNWPEDPLETVEFYLIPPKNKVTFGSRFDMTAGSHSDTHVHVRSVAHNPRFLDTADKIQENQDIADIFIEVRYIPITPPDFSETFAGAPSDMMWQIRCFINELIRSNPQQLEHQGVEIISIMQEVVDDNTPPDVHGQSAIEQLYRIVFTVKSFYTLEITRVE